MSSPLADRRLEIARAWAQGQAEPLKLDHTRLRFSLGTSLAELRVPFHVAPEVARIFTQSARQLVLMLVSRHRELLPRDDFDRFLVEEEFGRVPEISPRIFPGSGGQELRATAELGPFAHPALTGGLLAAWLGPGGGGRSLVALTTEMLRRAFAESGSRGREETATLTALILSTQLPAVETAIRAVPVPAPLDRYFRGAAGAGVYLALRLGVERALREARPPRELAMRLEACFSPATLLGGRPYLLSLSATLYGCDLAPAGALLSDTASSLATAGAFEPLREALLFSLAEENEASRRAEQCVALQALRENLLAALSAGEPLSSVSELAPLLATLRELCTRPQLLPGLLADEKSRKSFAKELARAAESRADSLGAPLLALADSLKAYREREPSACVGMSRKRAHEQFASALVAALADLWLERSLSPSRRLLESRTGTESEGGLEAEYAGGRLYRISVAEGPILRSQGLAPMAHLFVDVKDFTRRTALLGQAAMAEFLRKNFYLPTLTAAKKHFGGMSHLSDRGGVTVNNLLGDALSLSGEVAALVALSLEIRRNLLRYERELARAVSSEAVTEAVRGIEEELARRARSLGPGASAAQLASEREAALARARGEGLEAGVFVSFGPAPLVVSIEDEVFGRSRVAIADRINESARGTARSAGARARADAMLALERARRGLSSLQHPWAVFVGAPTTVSVPPAMEEAVRAVLRAGDTARALELLSGVMRDALEELSRSEPAHGDIYNAGAALSEEALLAFQEAMGERRIFRRLELDPSRLHPEIQRRYFFPPRPIALLVSFEPSGQVAEIFRFAGRVLFRGLEKSGGIAVWELVNEAGVGALFAQLHGREWLERER